jgi:hypothetical protein
MTQEQKIKTKALDIALQLYLGSDDADKLNEETAKKLGLRPQEVIIN